jgi:hypothetical protein
MSTLTKPQALESKESKTRREEKKGWFADGPVHNLMKNLSPSDDPLATVNNRHLFQAVYLSTGRILSSLLPSEQPMSLILPLDAPQRMDMTPLFQGHTLKSVLFWGQRKLLLSELDFLTRCTHENSEIKEVLCVGCAPGRRVAYLAEKFPELHFTLVAPLDFAIKESAQITIRQEFFTDAIAQQFAAANKKATLLFMSDIWATLQGQKKREAELDDMAKQLAWHKMLHPWRSLLRFHPPMSGHFEYLDGERHLEAWGNDVTRQCRLVTPRYDPKDFPKMRSWDVDVHTDQMFYFQTISRVGWYSHNLPLGTIKGVDHCHDCCSELLIFQNYMRRKPLSSTPLPDVVEEIKLTSEEIKEVTMMSNAISKLLDDRGRTLADERPQSDYHRYWRFPQSQASDDIQNRQHEAEKKENKATPPPVMSCRVIGRNFPVAMTESDLRKLLELEEKETVETLKDRVYDKWEGAVLITFSSIKHATTVVQKLDGKTVKGEVLSLLPVGRARLKTSLFRQHLELPKEGIKVDREKIGQENQEELTEFARRLIGGLRKKDEPINITDGTQDVIYITAPSGVSPDEQLNTHITRVLKDKLLPNRCKLLALKIPNAYMEKFGVSLAHCMRHTFSAHDPRIWRIQNADYSFFIVDFQKDKLNFQCDEKQEKIHVTLFSTISKREAFVVPQSLNGPSRSSIDSLLSKKA